MSVNQEPQEPNLPREPNTSRRLGRRPLTVGHEFEQWEYLRAPSNDIPKAFSVNAQGARHTKFGPGKMNNTLKRNTWCRC